MRKILVIAFVIFSMILVNSCEKDPAITDPSGNENHEPTRYHLKVPPGFPDYFSDDENQLTIEGIALGRKLFYDPILSRKDNISCSSCHLQSAAFTDPARFSKGTHGQRTPIQSMPITNVAWSPQLFWDGRSRNLVEQALGPVPNPIEMDLTWKEAAQKLQDDPFYPALFEQAFGTSEIDSMLVVKAITQFEMTIVSSNSKFDKVLRGEAEFNELEAFGSELVFNTEEADCFHCHGSILATDNLFHNNGLDDDANLNPGRFNATGLEEDFGKFKTPSLRNLAFTAPYMHDGRFNTLREVIDFYSEGVKVNRNIDNLMKQSHLGGVQLTDYQKEALEAFLLTMTDSSVVENPDFSDPNINP